MKSHVKPKKHLGQHFLTDPAIARKIVDALLEKDSNTQLLEVGPGTGVLTQYLIHDVINFVAMDVDAESVDFLRKKYPAQAGKIKLADFLEIDLGKEFAGPVNIIGNFPYNISSQIMFRVLEFKDQVPLVVGMFQREVALRLAEKPGSKVYGILSVLLQAFYEIEYLFTVDEKVFDPPPKVKSAVIRLTRNSTKKLNCDEVLFKKVVKTAFNQRRKTIRNSIRSLFNDNSLRHPLLDKRPEQLSVSEFIELTNLVGNQERRS
jgi:16S rRNA (adenine1518-N6/adenine1519-N6)-dimethyltransferase